MKVRFDVAAILVIGLLVLSSISFPIGAGSDPDDTITLVLTGDIMTGRRVEHAINTYDDTYFPFHGIGEYTRRGDLTFGNLETTISTRGEEADKLCTFRAHPKTLEGVRDAGFDVLTLANNHIIDYGEDATNDTMRYVNEYGMENVGMWYLDEPAADARIDRPVVLEAKGIRFAFLGYGENFTSLFRATDTLPGPVPMKMNIIVEDIEYARTVADVVVVAIHWRRTPQYVKTVDETQMDICRRLVDAGADVLACHGPHVAQATEFYNGSLILYSLGNTVFDQSEPSTHQSMLAMVRLRGSTIDSLSLVPLRMNQLYQYIPQGNILELHAGNGTWLDWDDYDSLMFSSDQRLTMYQEPVRGPKYWLTRDEGITAVLMVVIIALLFIVIRMAKTTKKMP